MLDAQIVASLGLVQECGHVLPCRGDVLTAIQYPIDTASSFVVLVFFPLLFNLLVLIGLDVEVHKILVGQNGVENLNKLWVMENLLRIQQPLHRFRKGRRALKEPVR